MRISGPDKERMHESGVVNPNALRKLRRGISDGVFTTPRAHNAGASLSTSSNTNSSSTRPGLQRLQRTGSQRRVVSSSTEQQRAGSVSSEASDESTSDSTPTLATTPATAPTTVGRSFTSTGRRPAPNHDDLPLGAPAPKRPRTYGRPDSPAPLSQEMRSSPDGERGCHSRAISISSGSVTSIPARPPIIKKEPLPQPSFGPARRDNPVPYESDVEEVPPFNTRPRRDTRHNAYHERPSRRSAAKSSPIFIKDEGSSDDEVEVGDEDEDESKLEPKPAEAHKDPPAILTTGSRSYKSWPEKDGKLGPTYGALLPDNYPAPIPPATDWICPVRGCTMSYKTLQALGGHFSYTHHHILFNDCQDGTLSEVGARKETSKRGTAPAIVVSQNPMLPISPSITPQSDEDGTPPESTPIPEGPLRSAGPAAEALGQSLLNPDKATSEPWHHVATELIHFHDHTIPNEHEEKLILYLMSLPPQRDLPGEWVDTLKTPGQRHSGPTAAIAMLIQITGKKGLCNNCNLRSITSCEHCVALPDAPRDIRVLLESSCCNCYYFKTDPPCAFAARQNSHAISVESGDVRIARRAPVVQPVPQQVSRSECLPLQQPLAGPPNPGGLQARRARVMSNAPSMSSSSLATGLSSGQRLMLTDSSEPQRLRSPLMIPTNGLGMEDWEFAPGRRVMETDSGAIENLAFSASYLMQSKAVSIGPSTTIQVLAIRPGISETLTPDPEQTRFCSVSSGKVKIKLDTVDDEEFFIGHRGVFTVYQGVRCTIENWFYEEATITVFSTALND